VTQPKRKRKPKKVESPALLKMFLAEYVSDRFPLSRIEDSWPLAKQWVDEYLCEHPGALEQAIPHLDPLDWELEELIFLLPGFMEFIKVREPGLHERPTGMY
jgi:hypothetical protein